MRRIRGDRQRASPSVRAARGRSVSSAESYLRRLEQGLLREIRRWLRAPSDSKGEIDLAFLADLSHVVAHWHDDREYLDAQGQPKDLLLQGQGASLNRLIQRVFPNRPLAPVLEALLRTGLIKRIGKRYRCTSRQLIFSAPIAAYLSGLIPMLGLVRTLMSNIAGEQKLLQQTVLNSHIPVRDLPALFRDIDERMRAVLQDIDALMIRFEGRAQPGEPCLRVGFAAQLFEFPYDAWRLESPALASGPQTSRRPP
jgi:hypothetical protein